MLSQQQRKAVTWALNTVINFGSVGTSVKEKFIELGYDDICIRCSTLIKI